MSALELLSGNAQTFLREVWATRTLEHRTNPDALVSMLSLADADHLLTSAGIRAPAVRVVHQGKVLPQKDFERKATLAGQSLTGLVDARKALAYFADGATVVFQGLHRYWPPLTRLVSELEAELGHPCQANAYLTPAGNQGFAVHSDTHDVFVFQTHGTKLWEIHDPTGAAPARDVLLEPGLSMYLPTGTPHAARAQDTVSLHVTIGINQLTWRGLLQRTLAKVMREVPDAHLPAGYLENPEALSVPLARHLRTLADAIEAVDADAAAAAEVTRFLTARPTRQEGGLLDLTALDTIEDATKLARRPGQPCVLRAEGDSLTVLLGDRSLRLPGRLTPVMERLRDAHVFAVAELADHLDEPGRITLCRRMVREGLLRIVG